MSTDKKIASSPTKSDESPQNTIRVIKANDTEQTVVEVKVAGEDGAKVTVFGGDGPVTINGIADKTDEKQPEVNNKAESKNEDTEPVKDPNKDVNESVNEDKVEKAEAKKVENEKQKNDADDDNETLEPLTIEEIDKIVSKYANKLNKKDLDKYLEFYWSVDEYGFGIFTFHQFVYRLGKIKRYLNTREAAEMFADLDHDNDRLVSLDEFLDEMSREKPRPKTEEEWKARFEYCDKNHDGFVCQEDIAAVLRENNVQYLDAEILYFLHQNKAGPDKKLDLAEFRWAVRH